MIYLELAVSCKGCQFHILLQNRKIGRILALYNSLLWSSWLHHLFSLFPFNLNCLWYPHWTNCTFCHSTFFISAQLFSSFHFSLSSSCAQTFTTRANWVMQNHRFPPITYDTAPHLRNAHLPTYPTATIITATPRDITFALTKPYTVSKAKLLNVSLAVSLCFL